MPAFAHDTSKHGTSVVFSLDDEEEVQALARAQAYVSKAVVCNKTTWSNSISERSDESITNSAVNLVAIGKTNDQGYTYKSQSRAMVNVEDMVVAPGKKRAKVRIVDEKGRDVALSDLAGRRWLKMLVIIKNLYIQGSGVHGLSRRLSYLQVSSDIVASTGISRAEAISISEFDLARDAAVGTTCLTKSSRKIIDILSGDGKKICLKLSGGGKIPSFGLKQDSYENTSFACNIECDVEAAALQKLYENFTAHLVKHRSTLDPSNTASDAALVESCYQLIHTGTNKKTGEMYAPVFKGKVILGNRFTLDGVPKTDSEMEAIAEAEKELLAEIVATDDKEKKTALRKSYQAMFNMKTVVIMDVDGLEVAPLDIVNRRWTEVEFVLNCCYKQAKNFGFSRTITKIIVESVDADEDLEPLEEQISTKRQKIE